jgi:mono/diheme cytochrome c family protein
VKLMNVTGALSAVVVALPAVAQQIEGDAGAGLELAEQLCTACHIVGTERVGSDVAPPFPAIARDPETTLSDLHAWHGPGHPLLPNLALTAQQIADVNAYLDSLRGPAAEPAEETPLPEGAAPRIETEEPPPAIQDAPPEEIGPPITPQPE